MAAIIEKGYTLWQWQYSYDLPEGFHASFCKEDKNFDVVTHNQKIQNSMFDNELYKLRK